MPAIKLVNNVPQSNTASAEFRLCQGNAGHMIARVGVHSGGQASIPISNQYTAQAVTTMGDFTLTSNTVSFTAGTVTLLAQVLTEDGYYDFRLVQAPGTQLSAIVCENTWRAPVQFNISQPGTPVQVVTVVDEHNNDVVSTAQQWTCYAIVNGITTATVTIYDPNATLTLTSDNNDEGYTLTVEGLAAPRPSSVKVLPLKGNTPETVAPQGNAASTGASTDTDTTVTPVTAAG
jgi:hypothetical protein